MGAPPPLPDAVRRLLSSHPSPPARPPPPPLPAWRPPPPLSAPAPHASTACRKAGRPCPPLRSPAHPCWRMQWREPPIPGPPPAAAAAAVAAAAAPWARSGPSGGWSGRGLWCLSTSTEPTAPQLGTGEQAGAAGRAGLGKEEVGRRGPEWGLACASLKEHRLLALCTTPGGRGKLWQCLSPLSTTPVACPPFYRRGALCCCSAEHTLHTSANHLPHPCGGLQGGGAPRQPARHPPAHRLPVQPRGLRRRAGADPRRHQVRPCCIAPAAQPRSLLAHRLLPVCVWGGPAPRV